MSKANGGFAALDKRALSDEQYRKERLARKLEEARKKAAEKKEAEAKPEQTEQASEPAPAPAAERIEKHREIIKEVPHVQPVEVIVDNHYVLGGTLWDKQQVKNDVLCVVMGMAIWALLGRKILWLLGP